MCSSCAGECARLSSPPGALVLDFKRLSGCDSPQREIKLLVVDDNSDWREFVRSVFGPCFSILECADGAAAVEMYSAQLPDWVLMDIVMSPVDGLAAASEIKSRHPEARIIFTTQQGEGFLREKAAALAPAGFVMKDEFWRLWEIMGTGVNAPERGSP